MMDRLGYTEFTTLQQLEEREPFGEYGAWMRTALLCATLVNINRTPGSAPVEIEDFMPVTMRTVREEPGEMAGAAKILQFFETLSEAQTLVEKSKAS